MAVFTANRKLDTFYFIYFLIHIPVTIIIDSALILPDQFRFSLQKEVLRFHISQNKDFLLLLIPTWLQVAGWCEILFQLPVFFIGLYSLWYDIKSYYPLISAYGFNAGLTTLFCFFEIVAYDNDKSQLIGFSVDFADKMKLFWVYFPTFLIPTVMFIDFSLRTSSMLLRYQVLLKEKKSS